MEGKAKVSHKSLKWAQYACGAAADAQEALAWQPSSSVQSEWKWSPESVARMKSWSIWWKPRSYSRERLLLSWFETKKAQNVSLSHCEFLLLRGLNCNCHFGWTCGLLAFWNEGFVTAEEGDSERGHPGRLVRHSRHEPNLLNHFTSNVRWSCHRWGWWCTLTVQDSGNFYTVFWKS